MLTDVGPTPPRAAPRRRWLPWAAGVLLFLTPLALWPLARTQPAPLWQALGGQLGALSGVAFASEQGLMTVFRWSPAGLMRSVDGGMRWTTIGQGLPVDALGGSMLRDLKAGNGRTLYALAGPAARRGLYRSSNGGVSFELLYQPLGLNPAFLAIETSPAGDLIALAGGEFISLSNDGGVTWRDVRLPGTATALTASQGPDGVRIWVTGHGWALLSSDAGQRWQVRSLPSWASPKALISPGRGPVHLYAFAEPSILRTTDEGRTWTTLNIPTDQPITGFVADPVVWQTLYLSDAGGALWRSDDWGETWRTIPGPRSGPIRGLLQAPGDRTRVYAVAGLDLWWLPQVPIQPTATRTATPSPTPTSTLTPTATATTTATPTLLPAPTATPVSAATTPAEVGARAGTLAPTPGTQAPTVTPTATPTPTVAPASPAPPVTNPPVTEESPAPTAAPPPPPTPAPTPYR